MSVRDSVFHAGGATFRAKTGQSNLGYAGQFVRFADLSAENYSTHRLKVAFQQTGGSWKVSADGSSIYIDGDRGTLLSLPTLNANSVTLWRERREQLQHRFKMAGQHTSEAWRVRSAITALVYDYPTRDLAGYVAFADQSDVIASFDVGRKQSSSSLWTIGGRGGRQDQAQVPLPNCAFDYSNDYTRLAVGYEGSPSPKTTVSFTAGPDFRSYTGSIDTRVFEGGRKRTSLWFEANFVSKPAPRLTIEGKASRSDWLSSTGKAALTDTCAETSSVIR